MHFNLKFLSEQMKNSLFEHSSGYLNIARLQVWCFSLRLSKKASTNMHRTGSPPLKTFHEIDVCLQINTKQKQKLKQANIPQHRCTFLQFLSCFFGQKNVEECNRGFWDKRTVPSLGGGSQDFTSIYFLGGKYKRSQIMSSEMLSCP